MAHQKAVLVFNQDEGGRDSLHNIRISDTDLDRIRSSLSKHGIQYRTLVPGRSTTQVLIYDEGNQLRPNVERFAESHQGSLSTVGGTGEFIGDPSGTSRAKARSVYRKLISEYEGTDRGDSPRPSVGVRQAPPETGIVERGIYYPAGQFLPSQG